VQSSCEALLNFFFYLLRLRRYKAKCVKTRCLQEWVRHFEPNFQGKGSSLGNIFFGFYKTRHILLSDSANCTVLRAVVLTQYRRVSERQTDRQTDGIAVVSTVLAMQISTGFASWLHYCTSVAQWRSTKLCTMFGGFLGWCNIIYTHFWGLLPPNGILPAAKFTLRPSLVYSYIGSVTAWHSSSGHQPNFAAWYLL